MALYAFDGTWNEEKSGDEAGGNTNVVKFRDMYAGEEFYVEGVGTRLGWFGKIFGGAFGAGGKQRIDEAYQALCKNYADGHTDIDIVGFSRGAALALQFANKVRDRGIREPNTNRRAEARPTIRFLGCGTWWRPSAYQSTSSEYPSRESTWATRSPCRETFNTASTR